MQSRVGNIFVDSIKRGTLRIWSIRVKETPPTTCYDIIIRKFKLKARINDLVVH